MTDAGLTERFFAQLIALTPERRPGRLRRLAAGRPKLRARLESLLAASEQGKGFLSRPPLPLGEVAMVDDYAPELTGQHCGPYRLVRELGRGGMGAVYLAERTDDDCRQPVAVKLIRPGADARLLLARFRRERQILAWLRHPHIARLLDGGNGTDGDPYIVMEYVHGKTIDRYCRDHNPSIDERLRLFAEVCEAVEYAHRRGVIHRDLKPGNILVTAAGHPKLLDFGIAKLLQPTPGDDPLTTTAHPPLTPEFAAPEQFLNGTVTPATDVYALGLILFELLTARRPYPCTYDRLREDRQPPLPSRAAPPALRPRLQGELDAIVCRALSYRPERRFGSARQLAQRVSRRHDRGAGCLDACNGRPVRRYALTAAAVVALFSAALLAPDLGPAERAHDGATAARACDALLATYRKTPTDSLFVQLTECRLKHARAFNDAAEYDAAQALLTELRFAYRKHPGRYADIPYAQAGRILAEFARTAYAQGDYRQALDYQQRRLERIEIQTARGGAAPSPAPVYEQMAQIYRALGRPQDAERAAGQARAHRQAVSPSPPRRSSPVPGSAG